MSSEDSDPSTPSLVGKGKRRADRPTERTPLLQDRTYGSTSGDILIYTSPPSSRNRLRPVLLRVFLISLLTCVIVAILVAVLAWSYASRVSVVSPDKILDKDVALRGPFHVDILNTTDDGGLWLNVSGRMGVDAGDAIGVNRPLAGEGQGLFEELWRAIGRWGIRRLDVVTVEMGTVHVSPEYDDSLVLLETKLPPLEVPLTVDPPRRSNGWLTPVVAEVFVRPTKNATTLEKFMAASWSHGRFDVSAFAGEVVVRGGRRREGSWKAKFRAKLEHVQTSIRLKIPLLPGLPHPGKNAPFPSVSDVLTLKTFSISSQHNLSLYGEATVINPLPKDFSFTLPSLPFTVSLPNGTESRLRVANVFTHPVESAHPNITIHISGTVPALPRSSSPLLSSFLSRYLNAEANPILISSPLFSPDPSGPLGDPGLEIPAEFPAPRERPQLLRDVTIKGMKIRPSGTSFLASGIVFAKVVLPKGIDVGVNASRVFPDVLVFDGEAPSIPRPEPNLYGGQEENSAGWKIGTGKDKKKPSPPKMPSLPDPLPEHAFGHIKPEDWLPSTSVRLESVGSSKDGGDDDRDSDGEREAGAVYAVSAKVVDVPLQVLPGRQREFSNFVGKVIFGSEGAVAGIQGYAAVTVEVDGLPLDTGNPSSGDRDETDPVGGTTLDLIGLPFRGSVRVGKKGLGF